MSEQPFKYEIRPLNELPPQRTIPGGRYDALRRAVVKELQPGWAIFVDHENGSKATAAEIRKMQPRIAQAVKSLGCKTRSDFTRMGVWVFKTEHLDAPLARADSLTGLTDKLLNGARAR